MPRSASSMRANSGARSIVPILSAPQKCRRDRPPVRRPSARRSPGGNSDRASRTSGRARHRCHARPAGGGRRDRKSVVEGKSVSVRVELGGRRINKKKKKNTNRCNSRKNSAQNTYKKLKNTTSSLVVTHG